MHVVGIIKVHPYTWPSSIKTPIRPAS
jgi:hypothetical protein